MTTDKLENRWGRVEGGESGKKVVVIDPGENNLDSQNRLTLRGSIDWALEQRVDVLVDLSRVSRFDSSGLCLLISLEKKLRKQGRRLKLLAGCNTGLLEILKVTRLDHLFEVETEN